MKPLQYSMRTQTIVDGDTSILFDADAVPQITSHHFEPAWWETNKAVVAHAPGRGQVCFVRAEGGTWALRHYRRGGWMARLTADLYFWRGLENTRPWREWKLTASLHSQGLPVPQPIAARVGSAGLFYRGDLITRRIEPAQTLADLLSAQALPSDGWRQLGTMLRRFHNAGVRHDDINARNVLLDVPGRFHLIDFDKAQIVSAGSWQEQNLTRFRRSLEKFKTNTSGFRFEKSDWTALLSGYVA